MGRHAADGHDVIQVRVASENDLAVTAHADWLIDLGPGAGHDGGRVVFTGTPAELVAGGDTLTARRLREYVGA